MPSPLRTPAPCLGLDFGTSNTALATLRDGRVERVALENEATTLPSAIFYGAYDGTIAFGRDAFTQYLEGEEGRLLRGVKTVLGTRLMHERTAAGVRIGGDRFDETFSLAAAMPHLGHGSLMKGSGRVLPGRVWFELATWHRIHTLYDRKTADEVRTLLLDAASPERVQRLLTTLRERKGHSIAAAVETAKIQLSSAAHSSLALDTGAQTISAEVGRDDLDRAIGSQIDRIRDCALEAVQLAGVRPEAIDALCYTGGSSLVPALRSVIDAAFTSARTVSDDAFGRVADGLAIEAGRRSTG